MPVSAGNIVAGPQAEKGMGFSQGDQVADISEEIVIFCFQRPIDFVDGIRGDVGVIVASLGSSEFFAALEEGDALGSQQYEITNPGGPFDQIIGRGRHGEL